ncbi:hypothetical protein H6G33_10010 [Calothrix sp. FACHB-1219]|uniref:hypothetical protein n=1 Tax=unclassified Calothrix TaxID=2619626 RepID=UPI001689342D|nr:MULTISPECIES: hypothetical protein [unclassified Calothrix]MBD2201681.1 hypothetical protein [Calothrix sp. FACHB-168]MBD2217367.1 hypothetical protein [Calothrix sp. FACHB-1219]
MEYPTFVSRIYDCLGIEEKDINNNYKDYIHINSETLSKEDYRNFIDKWFSIYKEDSILYETMMNRKNLLIKRIEGGYRISNSIINDFFILAVSCYYIENIASTSEYGNKSHRAMVIYHADRYKMNLPISELRFYNHVLKRIYKKNRRIYINIKTLEKCYKDWIDIKGQVSKEITKRMIDNGILIVTHGGTKVTYSSLKIARVIRHLREKDLLLNEQKNLLNELYRRRYL